MRHSNGGDHTLPAAEIGAIRISAIASLRLGDNYDNYDNYMSRRTTAAITILTIGECDKWG